ncbi:MAG: PAS domain-containing protein [Marinilabiliaceae bacterium]|nr:PAS domain-containing protein [Marinilabiliaceae bacterium]
MQLFFKYGLLTLLWVQCLWSVVFAVEPTRDATQTILLLNSYHRGFKWSDDITDAVLTGFRDSSRYRVCVEYMDSKRFQTPLFFQELQSLYRHKFSQFPVDAIICSDNNALDFIINHGDSIWGKVPVVFCGINVVEQYRQRLDTLRFTGVEERIGVKRTLQVAKAIQPTLKEFIVIGDKTLMYPLFREQFLEGIRESGLDIGYREVIVETPEQLQAAFANQDLTDKAVYLFSLYLNNNGFVREMAIEARGLFKDLHVPVYSNWDFLIPDLIVGGALESGQVQGEMASDIMKQRLCHNVQSMPFAVPAPHQMMFDHEQLNRFSIDHRLLPADKIIFNKDKGIFARYKTEMIIIVGFLVSLVCIIVLLVSVILFRQRAERELIESETRLELALEGANQGLWDIDVLSGSMYVNPQVAWLLGYSSPKELGLQLEKWRNLIHPNDLSQLMETLLLHQSKRADFLSCEVRMKTCQGTYRWVSLHGKITGWDNDTPVRYTGSLLDIDAQKEFENQLRLAKEKAEESDRLKTSFLANMSHEIRTPMNAILGFADLVTTDLLSEDERRDYLLQIKSSGESLLNLINDIIDISKIESGQLVIVPEHFSVERLLEKVERVGQTLIRNAKKDLSLSIVSQGGVGGVIYSDSMRLEQVILNLLTNAIKFTHCGEIVIRYGFIDDNHLKFWVRDTGIGIAEEYKKVIFERFRQGDESLAKQYGGNGLGLTISRSLVKMLGGDMEVTSTPGQGSEFVFSIRTVPAEVMV